MDYSGKDILIVGMARSGVAAAHMLHGMGARITLNDSRDLDQFGDRLDSLKSKDMEWRLGMQPDSLIEGRDLIVFSSGVPFWKEWILKARGRGIPCVNELEVGCSVTKARIAAITGTNGKTTTTTLLNEMARTAGLQSYAMGNIGLPLCAHAAEMDESGLIAAEVAPFQMISTLTFRPKVSVILNITEDHLDWFKTMKNYIHGKSLVFKNQQADDYCILNYDDPITRGLAGKPKARILYFSREIIPEQGAYIRNGGIYVRLDGKEEYICAAEEVKLPGGHNLENGLAASLGAYCMGIQPRHIATALKTFGGVEHRMETVATVDGVTYINDSKGTNPVATEKAVQSMREDTVLILGGSEKNSDFRPLLREMGERIVHIVAVGVTADRIIQTARQVGNISIEKANGFTDAVNRAATRAKPGMNVLLSPACASYDMFNNFEERGDEFKRLVQEMIK